MRESKPVYGTEGRMNPLGKNTHTDYQIKINRVFQYIDKNLDADLSLQTLSKIAFFSPYHFHRIFKFVTQETVNEYVIRKRTEKAASYLIHKDWEITEIALKCGFNENSSFTRTFKKLHGLSPTEFRNQHPNKFSKIRQLESKNGQAYPNYDKYICIITNLTNWIKMNAKIEVKKMPQMNVAYVATMGAQNLGQAFQKLIRWTTPLGLMNEQSKMGTIYHDSFKVTAADKVRMSACILLSGPVKTEGEIQLTSIEEGKFIVGSFKIGVSEFEKSWTGLFLWMNENGYKKAERDPFEIYHNNFNEHPEGKSIVDFYIPVE